MKAFVDNEQAYEDLLGQWADLESSLAVVLGHPERTQEFLPRIGQYDRWMLDLLRLDADIALYLLFQLAMTSTVGYSASHALVCALLCQLIAADFRLPQAERDALVHAAMTMNIAMTALQDQLANQSARPEGAQQTAIATHATAGALMLESLGVHDRLWLETVQLHHRKFTPGEDTDGWSAARRLAHILSVVDRYAAMISPRQSREGRSAVESAQHILTDDATQQQPVGQTLVRLVGLCPPGSFVQLDTGETAIVVRRSAMPNLPEVAIVLDAQGRSLKPPRLHHTASGAPGVKAALPAAAVPERLSHHLILKLGAAAA